MLITLFVSELPKEVTVCSLKHAPKDFFHHYTRRGASERLNERIWDDLCRCFELSTIKRDFLDAPPPPSIPCAVSSKTQDEDFFEAKRMK